ncbi:MAG TPA: hypothetical protein PKH01_04855, partial [Pseudomonadales bacterium]|nr:hypothetical protein [Pseudomonadales bacterium]
MPRSLLFGFSLLLSSTTLFADPATEIAQQVQPPLRAIYEARQFAPLWLENHQPSARANQALTLLSQAAFDGLNSRDYSVTSLPANANDVQQAQFDLALSKAVARFASDLHVGRVDPRNLGMAIDTSAKRAMFLQQLP